VKAYREGLDKAQLLDAEICRIELVCRDPDLVAQCAVTLDTQCFVELASVWTAPKTGGAFAAIRIGGKGDVRSGLEVGTGGMRLQNGGGDFVTGDSWIGHQGVLAAIGIQITAAQPDHPHTEQNLARLLVGLRDIFHHSVAGLADNDGSHWRSDAFRVPRKRVILSCGARANYHVLSGTVELWWVGLAAVTMRMVGPGRFELPT